MNGCAKFNCAMLKFRHPSGRAQTGARDVTSLHGSRDSERRTRRRRQLFRRKLDLRSSTRRNSVAPAVKAPIRNSYSPPATRPASWERSSSSRPKARSRFRPLLMERGMKFETSADALGEAVSCSRRSSSLGQAEQIVLRYRMAWVIFPLFENSKSLIEWALGLAALFALFGNSIRCSKDDILAVLGDLLVHVGHWTPHPPPALASPPIAASMRPM
jgi:hypothetical protein